jgi:hypothetical protein
VTSVGEVVISTAPSTLVDAARSIATTSPTGHPRLKIPFPTFDGESEPLTWLNKSENYFRGHCVPEDEKVWMASLYLNGTTAEWYYQM